MIAFISLPVFARSGVNDTALMQKRPAKWLSEYEIFSDLGQQTPSTRVYPYDLIVPLFTDYAHKYRFYYVPEGKKVQYHATEVLEFPVGSVLVKTFAYPVDFTKPNENIRLIETRLLIHQEKGWNAWAYVWNDEQTDAQLKVAGKMLPVSWRDENGIERSIDYVVPNKNQCKGCHTFNKAFSPIGPKARNMNHDFQYASGLLNQIIFMQNEELLEGVPRSQDISKVPSMNDTSSLIGLRARAYLDVNCAHCHRIEGPGSTSGLFLTYGEKSKAAWGYKKRPVAAGRGSGGFDYDIAPGDAGNSILIHRMQSTDPGVMMPELGRTIIDDQGIKLLKEWINQLK